MKSLRFAFSLVSLALSGCYLNITANPDQELSITINVPPSLPVTIQAQQIPAMPEPSPTFTPTPAPFGLRDENAVMSGICFEAAADAAGQVFIIRNAEEHIRFYDLADNSQLCRRPVQRNPFDFTTGRILAGLWSRGIGCVAQHDVLDVLRDNDTNSVTINLRFITDGDCEFELVRPFWISLEGIGDSEARIQIME